jgi:hypothetical protein
MMPVTTLNMRLHILTADFRYDLINRQAEMLPGHPQATPKG